MDPVTTAIVTAITAGVATGSTDAGKKAIVDSYEGLKALVKKKFGGNSEVVEAINKLETRPDSAGRREALAEQIREIKAAEEPDLKAAAMSLLELIKAVPNREQHIQQVAQGTGIAQAVSGSTASVNISGPQCNKNNA